jgi:hypothetical protein
MGTEQNPFGRGRGGGVHNWNTPFWVALAVGPPRPAGGDESFWEFGPYFFAFAAAWLVWRVVLWVRAKRQE